jgi:hypothetical protein
MVSYLYIPLTSKIKKMKTLLLIFSIAIFASCSTAYKSGQTPDDVYYSKPKDKVEENNTTRYEKKVDNYEDRQIRMAVHDPRWRNLDYDYDCDYRYSPYTYGYSYGYYYNPYYYPYPVYTAGIKSINPKNTTIRKAYLGGYGNTVSTYTTTKSYGTTKAITLRRYNNSNNSSTRPTAEQRTETRTYTPAPSNSNSGSSNTTPSTPSRGSSVPMPGRGGN